MDKPEPVTEQYDVSSLTYSQRISIERFISRPKDVAFKENTLGFTCAYLDECGQKLAITGIMGLGRLVILIMSIQLSLATIERATFNSRTQIVKMIVPYQMARDVSS